MLVSLVRDQICSACEVAFEHQFTLAITCLCGLLVLFLIFALGSLSPTCHGVLPERSSWCSRECSLSISMYLNNTIESTKAEVWEFSH